MMKRFAVGWLSAAAMWLITGQVLAMPGAIVLRVLDQGPSLAVIENLSQPDFIKTESLVSLESARPVDAIIRTSQPLTDFVFFSGSASDGILAFTGSGASLAFVHLDFSRGKIFDTYLDPKQRQQDSLNFNYVSLGKDAPTTEATSVAISVPTGGATYPAYAALTYYNQAIVFGIGKALNGNGQVTIVARIPGQFSGSAFLDNERLALVGPKGITLVSASTGAAIGSAEATGLSKVASYNGITIFWGNNQLTLLEANQLKSFNIPNETIDSCSIVLKNIPVCATSGKGKTLWYYSNGQLSSFWNSPEIPNNSPWRMGVGEGLILPFLTTSPDSKRLTLYASDGVEIGSQKSKVAGTLGVNLVSLVGLAAKLKNESPPVTEQVTFSPKECNRPYGSTTQVANWVLVTGCDDIALVDIREGRIILHGSKAEIVPSLIFQATGQRVGWNGGEPTDQANYLGLGQSTDGKPLLIVKQSTLQYSGSIANFPYCAAAFALVGDKFTTVAKISPYDRSNCGLTTGNTQMLISDNEIAVFSRDYSNSRSIFSVYDRGGSKRLLSFSYEYGSKTSFTVDGKPWRTENAPTAITDIIPTKDGYRLFGYFNGAVGSYEVSMLDGSLSKFVKTAPLSGAISYRYARSWQLPINLGVIGHGWQFYSVPTVEGLATPSYVSPEGNLVYLTDKSVIRIKLSGESINRWAGQ